MPVMGWITLPDERDNRQRQPGTATGVAAIAREKDRCEDGKKGWRQIRLFIYNALVSLPYGSCYSVAGRCSIREQK